VVIISQDVEKWMNEQFAKESEKRIVEMKTDVLGRAKNSGKTVQGAKEIENIQITEPKQKRLVRISEMHFPQIEMEPMHGSYEYKPETKEHNYYLNDKKVSVKEYETLMKKYYEKIDSQKKGKRKLLIPGVISDDELGWTALMTAGEISSLINNYKKISIDDYRNLGGGASVSSILSTIQLSTLGHANGYDGDGIGIYVAEPTCKDTNPPLVNTSKYTDNCKVNSIGNHHNHVVNIVQKAAPGSHIFGFGAYIGDYSANTHPTNPRSNYFPPIEIGNHSYMECLSQVTATEARKYKNVDMEMDRYIYENRMINFVCAGNKYSTLNCTNGCQPRCDTTSYVSSPGKALNAITVGAVDPATNLYVNYPNSWSSQWKNSEIENEKPEIAMYTNIDLGNYSNGIFDGCSAATPLAAGFLASVLEENPFYKEQPALVKAALLTSEKIPIQKAASWDTDNNYSGSARAITTYSTIADGWKSTWWNGHNSCFFDSNGEITFTENGIRANKRYKIAIAWLTEPSYTGSKKRISQDLDLLVYQNGQRLVSSTSAYNPYEVINFVAPSNAPLTIIIRRYRNGSNGDDGGNVFLGYNINYNY
jgi:hypothetical protein